MIARLLYWIALFLRRHPYTIPGIFLLLLVGVLGTLAGGKIYQHWDNDENRGAIAISEGAFGESYGVPVYLDQGWDKADSLWFYNTTQGSGLLPYDFFLVLEQAESEEFFRSDKNIDRYRYLPQKPTFFNPDGLPVGLVKDSYQGHDYMGFTCAACHTGQVNYQGTAIRIDGGPAMADMVGFLHGLEKAMRAAKTGVKKDRFVKAVLALDNDYDSEGQVMADLEKWTDTVALYNTINHSHVKYGYGRLDAFGRIYNRVLEHVINKDQLRASLYSVTGPTGERLLTITQIDKVLDDVDEVILGDDDFSKVIKRLQSTEPGYPGLGQRDMLRVRNTVFNEPDAPVSYPFLWDIVQSDYVQWNGLANNAGAGPLGRNTGEVIGVFGILDWSASEAGFSLSGFLSGQKSDAMQIDFKSSIDLVNLERLESHLRRLQSPAWPEDILGPIDRDMADRGRLIYAQYCESCHEVIDPGNWDRLVVARMSSLDHVGTDKAMASNSVTYKGKAGNFENTYQSTDVGDVVIEGEAPVVQILTSATKGVIGTPDPDKSFIRRWADWGYTLAMSFAKNDIKSSVKAGNYQPDTTAKPYQSLLSYKARSLNGIWATAPYLHNGSVPTLYDLLLPKKRPDDPEGPGYEYRPDQFLDRPAGI